MGQIKNIKLHIVTDIKEIKMKPKKTDSKPSKVVPKKKIPLTPEILSTCQKTDIQVPVFESFNDLARKYRGVYKLNLAVRKTTKRTVPFCEETHQKLLEWERSISKICVADPVIAVENYVDNEGPPKDFTYIRKSITSKQADSLINFDESFLVPCECNRGLCTKRTCLCPINSNGSFAYDKLKRILLEPGSPVYECNKLCKCGDDCTNRVIQKGLNARVCIFRTDNGRGWGLKAREFIKKGRFVVEYVGEIITNEEAEERGKKYDAIHQTYLFDLDFNDRDAPVFTIDAYKYGNVSHFINHSCDPNLHVYSVWVDTLDPRLPRIGLFAKRDIYCSEELTFDYMNMGTTENGGGTTSPGGGSNVPVVIGQGGLCACGTAKCRKFMF